MDILTRKAAKKPKFPTNEPFEPVAVASRYADILHLLDCHGLLSNHQIYAALSDQYTCRRSHNTATQKMRKGRLIELPRDRRKNIAQRNTGGDARGHSYIYRVGPEGKGWLEGQDLPHARAKASGSFWHDHLTSSITVSIDVLATRTGIEYLPARWFVDRSGSGYAVNVDGVDVEPDAIFGLSHNSKNTLYLLEVDLGSEDASETANNSRKSAVLDQKVRRYRRMIDSRKVHRHFKVEKADVKVLFAFNSFLRERRFLERLGPCEYIASTAIRGFRGDYQPQDLLPDVFEAPWSRNGHEPHFLSQ